MKCVLQTELSADVRHLALSDIRIGTKSTNLMVANSINPDGNGLLRLIFADDDFLITMTERGIIFQRTVKRPDHDHDDIEYLTVHNDSGAISWRRHDVSDRKYELCRLPFGPRTEGE